MAASISALTSTIAPSKASEVIPSVSHSPTWSSICGNPTVRLQTKPAIVTTASAPAAPQTIRRTRSEPCSSLQISDGTSQSDKGDVAAEEDRHVEDVLLELHPDVLDVAVRHAGERHHSDAEGGRVLRSAGRARATI